MSGGHARRADTRAQKENDRAAFRCLFPGLRACKPTPTPSAKRAKKPA